MKKAYSSLFELHGDDSWNLGKDELITFFRQSDQTSETIGGRQAGTFQVLASLSGHGDVPVRRAGAANTRKKSVSKGKTGGKSKPSSEGRVPAGPDPNSNGPLGLTVRVEINLPADGSKETYDAIFKSIRENLLGG